MRKHGLSPEDILNFIKSEQCNLAFEGIVYLDAREAPEGAYPVGEHPLQKLIDVAPGGISIRKALKEGEFTPLTTNRILNAAAKKFLNEAKGELEIQVSGGKIRPEFLTKELPTALRNESITVVNSIPSKALRELYQADPSAKKILAHPAILASVNSRSLVEPINPLDVAIIPRAERLLRKEIRSLFGPKLKELNMNLKAAERELFQANLTWSARTNEQQALGWKRLLPNTHLRLFLEKGWKRSALNVKRAALDDRLSEQRRFEGSLFSGKYAPHLEGAMLKHGIDISETFGRKLKSTLNAAIEKVVTSEKAELAASLQNKSPITLSGGATRKQKMKV